MFNKSTMQIVTEVEDRQAFVDSMPEARHVSDTIQAVKMEIAQRLGELKGLGFDVSAQRMVQGGAANPNSITGKLTFRPCAKERKRFAKACCTHEPLLPQSVPLSSSGRRMASTNSASVSRDCHSTHKRCDDGASLCGPMLSAYLLYHAA
jgi:hypothetical protein